MGRIQQVVSGMIVRFAFLYLTVMLSIISGSLLTEMYGKWRAAHPQLKITDLADSVRISWGPMYRSEYPGRSFFKGGIAAHAFFQADPVYFVAKDGGWEGLLVPETVLEHVIGRVRLLFARRVEQPAFEIRDGKLYQLVAVRPTWRSRIVHSWEAKGMLPDDATWALQVSRGYLRYYKANG